MIRVLKPITLTRVIPYQRAVKNVTFRTILREETITLPFEIFMEKMCFGLRLLKR